MNEEEFEKILREGFDRMGVYFVGAVFDYDTGSSRSSVRSEVLADCGTYRFFRHEADHQICPSQQLADRILGAYAANYPTATPGCW